MRLGTVSVLLLAACSETASAEPYAGWNGAAAAPAGASAPLSGFTGSVEAGAGRRHSWRPSPPPSPPSSSSSSPSTRRDQGWLAWLLPEGLQLPFGLGTSENDEPTEQTALTRYLAQYEDEVVARFEFATARDRKAFGRAAERLVLDVWAVNDRVGDVRIARARLNDFLRLLPKTMRHVDAYTLVIDDVERAVLATLPLRPRSRGRAAGFWNAASDDTDARRNWELGTGRVWECDASSGKATGVAGSVVSTARSAIATPFRLLGGRDQQQFFDDYRDLDSIELYLSLFAKRNSNVARVVPVGHSFQGRDILSIELGPQDAEHTVIVTAGAHGREWASIMALLAALDGLAADAANAPPQPLRVVAIPVLNADGYAHTWEGDRLWKKNRQPTSVPVCAGIDVALSLASTDETNPKTPAGPSSPCSENYAGTHPLEAVEAAVLADLLASTPGLAAHVDVGSYLSEESHVVSDGTTTPAGVRQAVLAVYDPDQAPGAFQGFLVPKQRIRRIGDMLLDSLRQVIALSQ